MTSLLGVQFLQCIVLSFFVDRRGEGAVRSVD